MKDGTMGGFIVGPPCACFSPLAPHSPPVELLDSLEKCVLRGSSGRPWQLPFVTLTRKDGTHGRKHLQPFLSKNLEVNNTVLHTQTSWISLGSIQISIGSGKHPALCRRARLMHNILQQPILEISCQIRGSHPEHRAKEQLLPIHLVHWKLLRRSWGNEGFPCAHCAQSSPRTLDLLKHPDLVSCL